MATATDYFNQSLGHAVYRVISDIRRADVDFTSQLLIQKQSVFYDLLSGTTKIIALYLTIWIMIEGYKVMWNGRGNINTFLYDATIKMVFIAISMFSMVWITLVIDAIQGIREFGASYFVTSSAYGEYAVLDKLAIFGGIVGDYVLIVFDNAKTFGIPLLFYGLVILAAIVGFFMGAFSLMRSVFLNSLSFAILAILTPLAFYFLIFKVTKNTFNQWLQMIISNILILLLLNLMLNTLFDSFILTNLEPYTKLDNAINYYKDAISLMFLFILYGILINVFCSLCIGIAEKLVGVSIDSLANSATTRATALVATTMGGGALGLRMGSKLGGKFLTSTPAKFIGKKAIETAKNIAGKFKK